MADETPHNVFISWSGPRAKHVATSLRGFLRSVIQICRPWMSASDIDAGTFWSQEIHAAMSSIRLGVLVVTPGNLRSTWLHYEAGGLVVGLGTAQKRVVPFLVGLKRAEIDQPLASLQAKEFNEPDTLDICKMIAAQLDPILLSDGRLDEQFTRLWPGFKKEVEAAPTEVVAPVSAADAEQRSADMLAEILSTVRTMRRNESSASLGDATPTESRAILNAALAFRAAPTLHIMGNGMRIESLAGDVAVIGGGGREWFDSNWRDKVLAVGKNLPAGLCYRFRDAPAFAEVDKRTLGNSAPLVS